MIEDFSFSILAIIGGAYIIGSKLRAIANRLPLSSKAKISLAFGAALLISGISGLFIESVVSVNAILFGCFLFVKMFNQEKSWSGHRFTTAYTMHCSGWVLSIGSILYGILILFE